MSASRPWKALERRHAKRMRGERLWRQDFSEVAPDGENLDEIWDTKCFKRFSVVELFLRCERKYRDYAKGRRFTLVLFSRAHPRAGDFVLVKADDYAADQATVAYFKAKLEAADERTRVLEDGLAHANLRIERLLESRLVGDVNDDAEEWS